jgi:hypothetical protein
MKICEREKKRSISENATEYIRRDVLENKIKCALAKQRN